MKTFSLTPEEKSNLGFRKSVVEYITKTVEQETQMYLELYVKKRLGLSPEDMVKEIDFAKGEIHVENAKDHITLPTNEEIAAVARPPRGN